MGALDDERRKHLEPYEIENALREHLRLPYASDFIWQIDGSVIVVWNPDPGEPHQS